MDQGTLQGIATILAMVAFLGVCWWAYSGHKKKDFDEAAQLPFVDDESVGKDAKTRSQEKDSPTDVVNSDDMKTDSEEQH